MKGWRDIGFVLAMRAHGESSAILTVFTREHGCHSGLVRGGAMPRMAAHLQPGNELDLTWAARLEDQLGRFTVEPLRSRAGLMADRLTLEALGAVVSLLRMVLPERAPHPALWQESADLLDQMLRVGPRNDDWPGHYLLWEMRLLEEMGYGLDLSSCAVTGQRDDLAFVSPKTGRAVSQQGAGKWADRLLPLPASLLNGDIPSERDLLPGLALTGHFLARELARELARGAGAPSRQDGTSLGLPAARERLLDILARRLGQGPGGADQG
ncbi:DNA repair protein RecO [Xinfangfangia sp. D13-10-4-6]|uniref:DNA repair protein RecO n=1 Tax=Pseudogemmobacter hezensis TaxID=2737662 RepID=UPI001554B5B1|nr:DNA repair protein RecO [Pseudogemmobacter hezensis]NPD17072.1 DNA repair protein RecO [Pseudogemmobacter hezensis]